MCTLTGTTICADHLHKPVKNIKTEQDEAGVDGFHSLMNCYVDILGLYAVPTKALSTLHKPLAALRSSLQSSEQQQVITQLNHTCDLLSYQSQQHAHRL